MSFSTTTTTLLRRSYWLLVASALPLAAGLLAIWLPLPEDLRLLEVLVICLGIPNGLILLLYTLVASPRPVPVPGKLVADAAALSFNGRRLARRSHILGGLLVPVPDGAPRVRLTLRFPRASILLAPANASEAAALLGMLGLDAASTVASFRVKAPTHSRRILFWLAVLAAVALGVFLHRSLFLLACGLVLLHLIPSRLVIGTDGLYLRWLGWRRFVPYGNVRSMSPKARWGSGHACLELKLAHGPPLLLSVSLRFVTELRDRDFALLAQRIREAFDEYRRRTAGGHGSLPERGARSTREWVRTLRTIGSGAHADHRTAPVHTDALVRLVHDATVDPATRACAAIALGAQGDEGRSRLRVAASSTAAPEVSALFRIAAEETSDEALVEALERISLDRPPDPH
jgi:hypothetical protein